MNYKKLSPEDFLVYLLEETKKKYEESKIKEKALYYSVTGTPIRRKSGVLIGLNWGGGGKGDMDKENHKPQDPSKIEQEKIETYKFIGALQPFLEKYVKIKPLDDLNYSNLCFFRSPQISDLTPEDWELSAQLFEKYIDYIQPPWIIFTSIGKYPIARLEAHRDINLIDEKRFPQGNRSFIARKGTYKEEYLLFTVPYPYRTGGISNKTRHEIWNWQFPQK